MKTILISIGAASLLAALAIAQPSPRYTVTDLGTLGGMYSYGYGINNAGEVSGGAATPTQTATPTVTVSVTTTPTGSPTPKVTAPDWKHGLNLKFRKVDQEFADAQKFGVEVFRDQNVGVTLYIAETVSLGAVKE